MIGSMTTFVLDFDLQRLSTLTPNEADAIPYGVVKLDDKGTILLYNQYNTENFLYKQAEVVGKNYFTEVVPCANNFMFKGRFFRGVESGQLDSVFDYVFTYRIVPTKVRIHLFRDQITRTNWIFVKKQ